MKPTPKDEAIQVIKTLLKRRAKTRNPRGIQMSEEWFTAKAEEIYKWAADKGDFVQTPEEAKDV